MCGVSGMECKCMEFMATGWCTRKWLRLYQTIRTLTFGDVGIMLVVIRPGVAGWKEICSITTSIN